VSPYVLISCKETSQIGSGPTLMASFNLNYLFEAHLQIYSPSEVLGIRTSTYEFGGTQFSPLTVILKFWGHLCSISMFLISYVDSRLLCEF